MEENKNTPAVCVVQLLLHPSDLLLAPSLQISALSSSSKQRICLREALLKRGTVMKVACKVPRIQVYRALDGWRGGGNFLSGSNCCCRWCRSTHCCCCCCVRPQPMRGAKFSNSFMIPPRGLLCVRGYSPLLLLTHSTTSPLLQSTKSLSPSLRAAGGDLIKSGKFVKIPPPPRKKGGF